jgi:hypothetical protein
MLGRAPAGCRPTVFGNAIVTKGSGGMAAIGESTLTRLQIFALLALAVVCGAATLHEAFVAPEASFLTSGNGAQWIGYPFVATSDAVPVVRDNIPAYSFTKAFEVAVVPDRVMLSARGLASIDLSINGATVLWDPPLESWREIVEVDVGSKLHVGTNEVRARVRNATGPALLQLALRGGDLNVETDTSWQVSSPGIPVATATRANDTQLFFDTFIMPQPRDAFAKHGVYLAAMFLLFAGLSKLAQSRLAGANLKFLPLCVLGSVTCYWLAVFVVKISNLPVMMGFDIPAHLAYFDHLLEFRTLPNPVEGWASYHPPLFYLLTSAVVLATDVARDSAAGQVVYRLVSFASGLTIVWCTHFFARRYFRKDPIKTSLATAFAGLLPMNLYVSAYVSNESLLAAWLSLAMFFACTALMSARTTLLHFFAIGAALGLGITTKFSGLALVPVIAAIVAAKIWMLEGDDRRAAARRSIAAFAAVIATTALVGGWFYLRNYVEYGEWVIWNVNLPGATTWWEYPGFHTSSYYLSFGESFRHPFFAGFHSFWDGLYSTLWGDGLLAGMVQATTRHPYWNYEYMVMGYWTAIPLSLSVVVGIGALFVRAFRDEDMQVRITASFVVLIILVLLFSVFIVTFRVPYYAQAKAFYILGATIPLSIAAATGLSLIDDSLKASRAAYLRVPLHGLVGMAAGVIVLSFLG